MAKKSSKKIKEAPKSDIGRKTYIILAVLVVLAALFIRSYHIGSLPPGVYPDEAVNGVDAINANATHTWKAFYENNNGREGLFMNLIALSFSLFGISVVSFKLWSIFFGTLTVLGMILLGEELFASRRAGIIAGFLTATSFWAINFSRIGFRAIMLPFVLVWSVFFLIRAIQKKKTIDYVLAGIFFGLGVHTYIAFRIAPLILVVLLIAFVISRKRFFVTHWKEILAFVAAAVIVALPMLLDFYHHPDHFSGRTSQVSVFNPEVNQGHLLLTLGKTFGLSLAQFNFFGDQNWRHNLPPWPELFPIIGVFFLAGLFYFLYEFFFLLWRRIRAGERSERFILVALLLSWFFVMLLPEAISAEGLPHALRSIGMMPVALLLAAFAIEAAFKWSERAKYAKYKKAVWTLLIVATVGSGIWSVKQYFVDWGGSKDVHGAFNQNFMNMAKYLNGLPDGTPKYVVDNGPGIQMEDGLQTSMEVVKLFTYQKTVNLSYLKPDFNANDLKSPSRVVLMSFDEGIIARIMEAFPGSSVSKDFTVVNVHPVK
ncbi:MAG: glycosyltransferase family 39 protein [Candidatus Moranbacteria bacterium]|nr:glycosyltransferase family 39 protein [Candidatus Moranbacteria bacterium]